MKFKICKVETIDSHSYPGQPKRFHFAQKWWDIELIEDRWYEGGLDPERSLILYYKVISEKKSFILRYLPYFQKWQVFNIEEIF